MPRQHITISAGQCGNQISARFWDLLVKQHSKNSKSAIYDDALSSFFRNTDRDSTLPVGSQISQLKARAVLIDMQQGVTNQVLKSDIGQLFDNVVNDVSGAGNNWAHGHFFYGAKYRDLIYQNINMAVEQCDSLQSFFLLHSIGGGTGSGLGTYVLSILEDEFPQIFRFTASVFPSIENDDVNVSPYNSMFSLYELMKHTDCSLPIDNQALMRIVDTVEELSSKANNKNLGGANNKQQIKPQSQITGTKKKAYDKMNNIIANLLSNLTCSTRFQGVLNVDFNEITMNLVPYPDLHFLISSLAPLYSIADPRLQPRKFDEIFHDIYDDKYQIIQSSPYSRTYLAMGLILRGRVSFSDVNKNIKSLKQKKNLKFINWNNQGFKYGICNVPPYNQDYSLLCLANNTCIRDRFKIMRDKYWTLYKRKLYTHNYAEYMDLGHFDETLEAVDGIIKKYQALEKTHEKPVRRLKPLYV